MGLLSALLQWNELDPPSRSEQLINDKFAACTSIIEILLSIIQNLQILYGGIPPPKVQLWSENHQKAWINEFHYENKGKDVNEVHHPLIHHYFLQVFFFCGFIKSPSSLFAHTNYILHTCRRDETLVSLNYHDEICCSS